jgi:magnesium chelatase subunit D
MVSPDYGRPLAEVNSPARRIVTVLSCMAVDRRIGGVIFVDLPPAWLAFLAMWLCRETGTDPARIVTLGSRESEDDLWWRPAVRSAHSADDNGARLLRSPGRLAEPPHGPPMVIIPDIARASLAVTRAAVVLAGADTAVLDRHGEHIKWEPRMHWLAACSRADLGRLSSHLLDRFPIRVDTAGLQSMRWSPSHLRAALATEDSLGLSPLNLPLVQDLHAPVARGLPPLSDRAAELIVTAVGGVPAPVRRDLALGRLARALAALDASEEVGQAHVAAAAALVGLAATEDTLSREPPPALDPVPPDDGVIDDRNSTTPPGETTTQDRDDGPPMVTGDAEPVGAMQELAVPPELTGTGLYTEDDPESLPEFASLRHPWQWRGRQRVLRGLIVGTEPTRELTDLSIMSTVLEAAKYQSIRRAGSTAPARGIVIYGADLRRHRRQSGPDSTVAFVLDHTCRRAWQWSGALAPYLGWAYTRRAAVTVVDLGHRDSANDLRAEVYRATSVLDRRITTSLSRSPGRASPLAYGLDLVIQALRRQLRYGAAATEQAWLVVVTDGRGNVPLEASLRGQLSGSVGTEGIRDALTVAAGARSLSKVRPVVIAPEGLTHYPELPFDLADALGGIVADAGDGEI